LVFNPGGGKPPPGSSFRFLTVWLVNEFLKKLPRSNIVKNNRGFCLFAIICLLVLGLSAPAIAGKKALKELNEEEMEEITAAGDPTVVVSDSGNASYTDQSIFSIAFPEGAQDGLRALTVQNVVGEVQLLVNLNVLSASGDVNNTDQRNFAVQSWGSTLPVMAVSVDGEDADGGDGGPGIDQGGIANTIGNDPFCVGLGDCTSQITAVGGSGGNGAVAPGVVEIGSASADVIVKADGEATVTNNPIFSLAFEPGAQTNMGALFIANIVGRAQTAFNINIASSRLNLFPSVDGSQPFAEPLTNATGTIKQVNSGVQFRGTPLGIGNTHANVQVTHTPN
jgi:hypothetical protein